MVSIDPACGMSSAFSCAGSKSTTVTSRSSSGSPLLRAPDHHRPTKVALGNIVQALVERPFAWLGRCRRLAKDWLAGQTLSAKPDLLVSLPFATRGPGRLPRAFAFAVPSTQRE